MKQKYENHNFNESTLFLIGAATGILEQYDVVMTVRQLYYQLVSADLIPNTVQSYKRIVSIMRNARMAGLLDWDYIEDRLREPRTSPYWSSIEAVIEAAKDQFRLNRWQDQWVYLEIWLEKDALAGIVGQVARHWQLTLQVNRGYSSVTAMREAALRFKEQKKLKKAVGIGYLGDHDPSGEDMVRDIKERLDIFGVNVEVNKIAIQADDIETYHLPPQPVKSTDSRAGAFREAHGEECVELDALRPDVLQERVRSFIHDYVDQEKYDAIVDDENRQRAMVQVKIN